jgi:heme/copper-type cytochrome/quinol oxidase subunit 2
MKLKKQQGKKEKKKLPMRGCSFFIWIMLFDIILFIEIVFFYFSLFFFMFFNLKNKRGQYFIIL